MTTDPIAQLPDRPSVAWQLVIYRIAFQNGINDLLYLRLDKRGTRPPVRR
ncbi:MAG: hypothetical protein R3B84_15025 [Zavarzinella sp.]